MADVVTGVTRGGETWTPAFVNALDQGKCIGCGRCYKVCPREVFELVDREDLDLDDDDDWDDDDDDDGFSDDTSMVMNLMNALDCIGCQACSKVCPKKCLSHEPADVAA
ncbi:ferredoxin III, nif-specific [Thiosocius teredinicola]|uniref:ferredoxin III, nif-specific n=1 Tax=Thiosocius teredinicola TaxID=1973002 RepID=UPI00099112EC